MSGSVIKQCSCEHTYQDKVYGHKQRVHNLNVKKDKATCTVCSSIKTLTKG